MLVQKYAIVTLWNSKDIASMHKSVEKDIKKGKDPDEDKNSTN